MTSFAFDRDGNQERPRDASSRDSLGAESRAELLDEVLQQTRALISNEDTLEPDELEALRAVRSRHKTAPLGEPVVTELVNALMLLRFGQLARSGEFWQRLSRWIAETLLEDPASRGRLETLWAQLSEVPP